ncbi:hypothetical protein CPB97_001626 [Podila verticillata]|nr:hypothetical protein CPB97_001626 [Podila verticillata]
MEFSSFLPSFPPSKRLSALTITSPTTYSPVLSPEPAPLPAPAPMPHLSASRVLFEEGLYSDVSVLLQVPGSVKKTLALHSRILTKESEIFAALLAGNKSGDKAITVLDEKDSHGSQVVEIQCVDAQELYAIEASLRLLYTGSWCSDRDFQTTSLDARLRRGLDVMSQAGRLSLKGSTTALLQEEITQMCQNQPELLEKVSKKLRPEDCEDDQAILKFDRDALQAMCRVAITKVEIRDHCELAIARNLYGPKKFRDLRMSSEVDVSNLRPGYLFPPGGQESIYLLKGAPSLPLHRCRATNIEALRHVVDYYTAYNSQQPLRNREYYVVPSEEDEDEDEELRHASMAPLQDVRFYRVAFSTGYQWLMDQVIKVRAPFELVILLLKDAVDENADRNNNVSFGEFASVADGDVYLQGVSYIADGLLHAFQDPSLESFRHPGSSGSLLNMISYGINSLVDLPPLRPKPKSNGDSLSSIHHQEYPALVTLVMEFFWQILELALKRPHHLDFVQLLLDSITKIAPLSPFEVVDRIEERLAELLEESRRKIMEQRGEEQEEGDEVEQQEQEEAEDKSSSETAGNIIRPRVSDDNKSDVSKSGSRVAFSDGYRSEVSGRSDDNDERYSVVSSVLLASEPSAAARTASVLGNRKDDTSSMHEDEDEDDIDEAEEADADSETPWMRPEYLQPLCLQLLISFPMNIQSSLLWAIHDLQLL